MKKSFVVVLTGLMLAVGLAGPAQAETQVNAPTILNKARAIPTQSGENVRITIFTRYAERVKVRVDGSDPMKGLPFGTGCGRQRCQKWKVYAVRGGNECYQLKVSGVGKRGVRFGQTITACEPFRGGAV